MTRQINIANPFGRGLSPEKTLHAEVSTNLRPKMGFTENAFQITFPFDVQLEPVFVSDSSKLDTSTEPATLSLDAPTAAVHLKVTKVKRAWFDKPGDLHVSRI